MSKKLEELRNWVKKHGKYRQIADATGYNYHSLLKFISGEVEDPQFTNVELLIDYKERTENGTG